MKIAVHYVFYGGECMIVPVEDLHRDVIQLHLALGQEPRVFLLDTEHAELCDHSCISPSLLRGLRRPEGGF